LVERRRSEADGRGRLVRLTPAGRRLIDEAFTAHLANEKRLLEALNPEETAQLERLLTAWLAQLEPVGGETGGTANGIPGETRAAEVRR
jgi:DNA-binding MarR family transcriptional regulator